MAEGGESIIKSLKGKRKHVPLLGLCCGFLNGLFGAGGGIAAVFFLKKLGLATKKAHATSIAIILPLSIVSATVYWFDGAFSLSDAWVYLPGAAVGAFLGGKYMKKIPDKLLRLLFNTLIIISGVRLIFA